MEGSVNWLLLQVDWLISPIDGQFKAFCKVMATDRTWQTTCVDNVMVQWHDDVKGGDYYYHSVKLSQRPTSSGPAPTTAAFLSSRHMMAYTLYDSSTVVQDVVVAEGGCRLLVLQPGMVPASLPLVDILAEWLTKVTHL